MVEADISDLANLWVASWTPAMPAIDFAARRDWITTFLRDPRHRTIVAMAGLGLGGFVSLEGRQLHQLVVTPAAKGTGLATVLLDRAKRECPGGLRLDVNQANGRALRFYEREGFIRRSEGVNPSSGLATWGMAWPA